MISLQMVVQVVLYLIVAGLIFWLLDWLIRYIGVPDPFAKVCRVILAVCAVFIVIGVLLSLIGGAPVFRW